MDTSSVIDLAREAMWVTIMVSAPLLAVVLVIGVLIGIVQAATSINEMTLSFIPKLVALALARSEEHTSERQSRLHHVCRLLLEK